MATRGTHRNNMNAHRERLGELKEALAAVTTAVTQGADDQIPELRAAVQAASRAHQEALAAVIASASPEQAEDAQLEEGRQLAATALVLVHAWSGATAEAERATHLAERLRDTQADLERARSQQAEGSGRSTTQGGHDSSDKERNKLPELKVKAFSGTDKEYTVQQFLFLARRAARATSLDTQLYRDYTSLDLQQIDARIRCMEGPALDWASQHDGKFSELARWEAALQEEFTVLTSTEARAELYRLRYDGQDLTAHDAQFRRLSSLVHGLSEQEAVTAYIHTLAQDPDLREQVERAAPATWQEAAKVARREVRILEETRRAKGSQAAQGTRARRPEREQLNSMGAATAAPSNSSPSPELQSLQSDLAGLRETLNLLMQQRTRPPLTAQDFGISEAEFAHRRANRRCFVCGQAHCHTSRHPRQQWRQQPAQPAAQHPN